jgi:phosphatidylserine/phosphatidylglycerophosphate/cardiolipin synthase-like enzyme
LLGSIPENPLLIYASTIIELFFSIFWKEKLSSLIQESSEPLLSEHWKTPILQKTKVNNGDQDACRLESTPDES